MGARDTQHVLKQPGSANAEAGLVLLDGPGGVAVTMTIEAAFGTGQSLIRAAEEAQKQVDHRSAD